MAVMIAAQSGTLLRALRVLLKRGVSVCRRGGALRSLSDDQEEESPTPEQCVTPFACKLLPEKGFGFRTSDVIGCCMFLLNPRSRARRTDNGEANHSRALARAMGTTRRTRTKAQRISPCCAAASPLRQSRGS